MEISDLQRHFRKSGRGIPREEKLELVKSIPNFPEEELQLFSESFHNRL